MALPVTITGISTAVACVGPFKSSAGNFYFFGRNGTTATTLSAFKASDPTSSWSSIATKTGFTTAITNLSAFQVGDVIHMTVCDGTLASSLNQKYQTFNMSSDTFVTAETIASGLATAGQTGAGQPGASIVVRSNGNAVAFFNGAQTKKSGTNYARVYWSERTGVNTWSAAAEVDAAGAVDSISPEAALGASDAVHFLFKDSAAQTIRQRTLNSSNSLQTAGVSSNFQEDSYPVSAVSYDNSGTQKIAVSAGSNSGGTSYTTIYFDSGNTPTLNLGSVTIAGGTPKHPGRMFVDAGDSNKVWLLVRNNTDSDLYVSSSTDNGQTFGGVTNAFTATVGDNDNNLSHDGNIYQRGSNFVIPYIVNDNGTLKYNEYTVRTVSNDKTLPVDAGAYNLTGTAVTLRINLPLPVDAGSYALTGTAVTLHKGYPLIAAAGNYALTGTVVALLLKRKLAVDAGTYALTGTAAGLNKGQRIVVDAGAYNLTGTDAAVLHKRRLAADAGAYALTGTDAAVLHKWKVLADAGAYALTGTDAALRHGFKVIADAGAFSLSGTDAALLHKWFLLVDAGSYLLTGTDANLVKVSGKTLSVDAGAFVLTGTDAAVLHGLKLIADSGDYMLTGTDAALLHQWKLSADAGAYELNGTDAALYHGWTVAAGAGSYILTGSDVTLTVTGGPPPPTADFRNHEFLDTVGQLMGRFPLT